MYSHKKNELLYFGLFLIFAIALLHISALNNYYYWIYSWFDLLVHFLGGMWVAVMALWIYFFSGLFRKPKMSKVIIFWLSFLAVLSTSLLWEIYEVNIWRHLSEPDFIVDTITDTLAALAGSYMAYTYFSESYKNLMSNENGESR